jgi:hypothetical protein
MTESKESTSALSPSLLLQRLRPLVCPLVAVLNLLHLPFPILVFGSRGGVRHVA